MRVVFAASEPTRRSKREVGQRNILIYYGKLRYGTRPEIGVPITGIYINIYIYKEREDWEAKILKPRK